MSTQISVNGSKKGWLDSLRAKVNDVIERWFYGKSESNLPVNLDTAKPLMREFDRFSMLSTPAVDVIEQEEELLVLAEVPGFSVEDIKVSVEDGRLFLQGEKRGESSKKSGNYTYRECHYGSFSRTIKLPAKVTIDESEAKLENGVLEVKLKKDKSAIPRSIRVTVH